MRGWSLPVLHLTQKQTTAEESLEKTCEVGGFLVRYIRIGTQCNPQLYPIRHAATVVLSMYHVAFS